MARSKIAITLKEKTVKHLDDLVKRQEFDSRSQAIQQAVDEKLERLARTRLAEECAKLDPERERALAEEGMGADAEEWPEY